MVDSTIRYRLMLEPKFRSGSGSIGRLRVCDSRKVELSESERRGPRNWQVIASEPLI